MKTHVHALVAALSASESALHAQEFLAPVVRGGRIRLRVAGMVHPCAVAPAAFQGWGVFRVVGPARAQLVRRADHPAICGYLERLPLRRARLAVQVARGSWLAVPLHGSVEPVRVHLTHGAQVMDVVRCRFDGAAHWFEDADRTSDPRLCESLRTQLDRHTDAYGLKLPGLTDEARAAYALAMAPHRKRVDEVRHRLDRALRTGGGTLQSFTDEGVSLDVRWLDRDGVARTSTVKRDDLTVVSSGICLSGMDEDFDLTSLVGVMAGED